MLVQRYRGRGVPRTKRSLRASRRRTALCPRALLVLRPAGALERSVADLHGRQVRLEVAEEGGGVRVFTTEDLSSFHAVAAQRGDGGPSGALLQVRPEGDGWDPSGVKTGDLLRHRSMETGSVSCATTPSSRASNCRAFDVGARMLLARGSCRPFRGPASRTTPTPADGRERWSDHGGPLSGPANRRAAASARRRKRCGRPPSTFSDPPSRAPACSMRARDRGPTPRGAVAWCGSRDLRRGGREGRRILSRASRASRRGVGPRGSRAPSPLTRALGAARRPRAST